MCLIPPLRPSLRPKYKWKSQAKSTNKNSCKHNGKVLANWFVADVLLLLPTTIVRRCQTCGRSAAAYLVFYFNYLINWKVRFFKSAINSSKQRELQTGNRQIAVLINLQSWPTCRAFWELPCSLIVFTVWRKTGKTAGQAYLSGLSALATLESYSRNY